MATRRTAILAFLAALTLILSVGVVVRAAPDADAPTLSTISWGDGSGNVCTGTLSDGGNTCTINSVDLTGTGNNDECSLFSTDPNVTQRCIITQTSAGDNNVRVRMVIAQSTPAAVPNTATCPFPLRSLVSPNQNGCQILTVTQTSDLGSNSLDAVLAIGQRIAGAGGAQRQNAGQDHTVNQCSGSPTSVPLPCQGPGTNLATLNLGQGQDEQAQGVAQQQQRSTANGDITQFSGPSAGSPQATRNFGAVQRQQAPPGSTQQQDPDDFCCSGQGSSPNAVFNLRDFVLQIQDRPSVPLFQRDQLFGQLSTTGTATINQQVTRFHGATSDTFANSAGCTGVGGLPCSTFAATTCGATGCFQGGT